MATSKWEFEGDVMPPMLEKEETVVNDQTNYYKYIKIKLEGSCGVTPRLSRPICFAFTASYLFLRMLLATSYGRDYFGCNETERIDHIGGLMGLRNTTYSGHYRLDLERSEQGASIAMAVATALMLTTFTSIYAAAHDVVIREFTVTTLLICGFHHLSEVMFPFPCWVSNGGRNFSPAMYLEWMTTSPLMIWLVYSLTPLRREETRETRQKVLLEVQLLNFVQLLAGALGSLTSNYFLFIFFHILAFSCFATLHYLAHKLKVDTDFVGKHFTLRYNPLVINWIAWSLFPTVHILAIFNLITCRTETHLYGLSDILSKIVATTIAANFAYTQQAYFINLLKEIKQKQEKQELEITLKFIRYIFHEVRVPLNSVVLGLRNMQDKRRYNDKIVRVIIGSTNIMSKILNDFLSLEKIMSNKMAISIKDFSIAHIFLELRNLFAKTAEEKDISLVFKTPNSKELWCRADRLRVTQVLSNFLSNALKFTDPGGEVRVKANFLKSKNVVLFSVKDNGIGISEKDKFKLFQPFTQIDAGVTQKGKGTGLGLVVSRELVYLMNGNIGFQSASNEGSIFYFSLPAVKPTNDRNGTVREIGSYPSADYEEEFEELKATVIRERRKNKRKSRSGNTLNVLIVDDVSANSKLLKGVLKHRVPCEFAIMTDGKEVLDNSHNISKYDVIFMDNKMPILNGTETTRHLRAGGYEGVIIGVTGDALQEDQEAFLEAGADVVFSKPVDIKLVVQKLSHFFPTVQMKSIIKKRR